MLGVLWLGSGCHVCGSFLWVCTCLCLDGRMCMHACVLI